MKTIRSISAIALLWAGMAGCSDDRSSMGGEGTVQLSASISTAVTGAQAVSRASSTADELSASCIVWISGSKGAVRKYQGLDNIPASIALTSGSYVAEAWAGDSVPASFTDRYFKGREEFAVTAGETTPVQLTCRVANAVVSVSYDDAVDEALSDYTMTVGHVRGSLEFVGRDSRKGYFMMPSDGKTLTYTLSGTQLDGSVFTSTGTIENPVGGTEYKLTVNYTPQPGVDHSGGGYFTIEVDESTVDENEEIVIDMPPAIIGVDFDIDKTLYVEQGAVGRRSVFIVTPGALTSVSLGSALLGDATYDFRSLSDTDADALHAAGITWSETAGAERSTFRINFEQQLTDALATGEYAATISATDASEMTSTATFALTVVEPGALTPVATDAVNDYDVWATRATVSGTIIADNVTSPSFRYREKGAAGWAEIPASGVATAAGSFTAEITGLTPGTEYELTAFAAEGDAANIVTFTTEAAAQVPNCGFEDWDTSGTAYIPAPQGADRFWDSGNHGSTTLGSSYNITVPESTLKHSGNYSAKLGSKYIVLKFAAGNIFTGQYIHTDGSNGVLGFGRPFTSRPSALHGYVKYTPDKVASHASGSHLGTGDSDKGHIYVAVLDDNLEDYEYKGEIYSYPVIIKTRTAELFDKNSTHVIAYGENVLSAATSGDGLVEFTIPLDYRRTDIKASHILIVCSASYYGDYFEGGDNSVMYVDDFELIYE